MAPSTIRKAIGAVKDQTSIGIAKVSNNMAVQLEILVVKATSHDEDPADERHVREILAFTAHSKGYLDTCFALIARRLSRTRDWMVALKCLLLIHRVVVDGHPGFEVEIVYASHRGMRLLNMSHFRDEAHPNSGDHSGFLRFYAMYLEEKVEFSVFEKRQEGGGVGAVGKYEERQELEFGRTSSPAKREIVPIKEMGPERVLFRLNLQLRILDRVLACRPAGAARNSRLVLLALYQVLKESFALYGEISEGLEVLQDRFALMQYGDCLKAFDTCVGAAKLIDELMRHYNWCRDAGIARMSEFPEVQRVTDEVLGTLEELLKEMNQNRPNKNSPQRIGEAKPPVEERSEPNMNEMRALPAPENHIPPAPLVEPRPDPQPQHATGELIDLSDDSVSADEQGNKLAVALFSSAPNASTDRSWGAFPSNGQPEANSAWDTAWDTPAADDTKADWELLLVETASNLAKQKADMAGGFDPLLLSGMYDQGAVRQHVSADQSRRGSASSVASQVVPGKAENQILALPAPDGTVQPVGPQDPFSASLAQPPPPYVQMADVGRKQELLVQEQQMWGNHGMMQGHQMSSGYYGPVPGNMAMPYGMPQGGFYHTT
ncbi:putative clathrin assembly protein At2g25430 [Rhodamnia argentea]|uniref:Clathrin assembly protein At2g25430 n=1 Tax=Rhodamnia argentea TaxID=178133 RepID=A0A8B8MZ34_9MYRT|nr:putative clathrin assembly protein At2g25430 [Rhodamnia argentea]